MKKDSIITLPNARLRQRSSKVSAVSDEVRKLIADMQAAILDWEDSRKHEVGVALAAVQVDKLKRIVVVRNNFDDRSDRSFSAFINPEITKYQGEITGDFEGCLSIKDIYGKVPRHAAVRVRALDAQGHEVRLTAEGFLARVLQHEIDHTNGKVFIDHIKDNPESFFKLTEEGKLEPLDYEKDVKDNEVLWGNLGEL